MLVGLLGCRQLDLDFSSKWSKLWKSHQKIKICQESFLEDSNRVTKHRVWIIVYVHNWIISFGTNFDLLMTTPRRNAQRVARSTWQTLPPSGKPETHQIEIFRLTIFIIRRRKSRVICLLLRLVFWQIRGTRTNLKSRKNGFGLVLMYVFGCHPYQLSRRHRQKSAHQCRRGFWRQLHGVLKWP